MGNAVEPTPQRRCRADRTGLLGEDEEGSLKGVLGIGAAAQHAAADVQDHRPVPAQQGVEGSLILLGTEPLEQVPVG